MQQYSPYPFPLPPSSTPLQDDGGYPLLLPQPPHQQLQYTYHQQHTQQQPHAALGGVVWVDDPPPPLAPPPQRRASHLDLDQLYLHPHHHPLPDYAAPLPQQHQPYVQPAYPSPTRSSFSSTAPSLAQPALPQPAPYTPPHYSHPPRQPQPHPTYSPPTALSLPSHTHSHPTAHPSPFLKRRRLSHPDAPLPLGPGGEQRPPPVPTLAAASGSGQGSGYSSGARSKGSGVVKVKAEADDDAEAPTAAADAQGDKVRDDAATGAGMGEGAKTEKSCKHCRARKVRCSRTWPTCTRCHDKGLECHYGNLVPIDLVKTLSPDAKVAELEARIKSLELELAVSSAPSLSAPAPSPSSSGPQSNPYLTPPYAYPPASLLPSTLHSALLAPSAPLSPKQLEAHVRAVLEAAVERGASTPGKGCAEGYRDGRFGPPSARSRGGGAPGFEPDAEGAPAVKEEDGPGDNGPDSDPDAAAYAAFVRMARVDAAHASSLLSSLSSSSPAAVAASPLFARLATLALLDAFWSTCSSNVPTFLTWHAPRRKLSMYTDLEGLGPPERCVVAAMCAVAVRSTDRVALLGLGLNPGSSEPEGQPRASPAVRRELAARSVRGVMLGLYDELEVGVGEGTRAALEATVVCGVVSMWNELVPRRSRAFVRTGLGLLRDLLDGATASASGDATPDEVEKDKTELVMYFGLPLLVVDSTTSAYLRAAPLISPADLSTYFAAFPLPSFPPSPSPSSSASTTAAAQPSAPPTLAEDVAQFFTLDRIAEANHMQLLMGSLVAWKWLAGCLRAVAEWSCPRGAALPLSAPALSSLFSTLSALHTLLHSVQAHLLSLPTAVAHPSCLSPGPQGDTCESVHLRWTTRLDREADNVGWLAYAAVGERMLKSERSEREHGAAGEQAGEEGMQEEEDEEEDEKVGDGERLDVGWLRMCEGKVRQGLKLAAFYFHFFTLSPDPHQTHHLVYELELIPSWPFLATQRFSPSPQSHSPSTPATGPASKEDELTPLELDWIERGLEEACKYHPVAERRLVELRAYRAGERRRAGQEAGAGEREGEDTSLAFLPTPATTVSAPPTAKGKVVPFSNGPGGSKPQPGFREAMRVAMKDAGVERWV
ncbi:hypothetical protein JCM10207_007102 [Rhodosporidiobolus poonsookiae]